jgi:acetyl-CoA C-acetyltransferase
VTGSDPHPRIAVIGAHHTPLIARQDDMSLEEMVFEATRGALADAGLTIDDIDGIVLATSDQVQGRVIESMVTNGAAGGVNKDTTTLASGGEHSLIYAYLRLLAGQGRRLLVATWGKPSESVDVSHAALVEADPFFLRPLGMTATVAAGLQGSRYIARYGHDREAVRAVRAARKRAGEVAGAPAGKAIEDDGHVIAWPLTTADLPVPVDVAAAIVLCTEDVVSEKQAPAWVVGVGWSTDGYDLADRELSGFGALAAASERAAQDGSSIRDADVVEVQEISTIAGFAACEALGLSAPGEGAEAGFRGRPVINPSGGNLAAHPSNAAGFLRFFSAAQQARGRAGAVQLEGVSPLTAVGAAIHGFAGQGAAVMVFRGEGAVA